ncbi:MAG: toxin-antitoxin system HicB family antitoxin [Candidatus Thiothrix sulfatifontis]|nr:MAG: toxin-antitoxin system HicB family antitoxin [Candidatus Thiothrix sulfatifontis]
MEETKRSKRIARAMSGEHYDHRAQLAVERLAVYHSRELDRGELPVALYYSGKVSLCLTPELHAQAAAAAKASSRSLNGWLVEIIKRGVENPIEKL